MPKPRFTDKHRYPRGWTPSHQTNIAETFARVREQQAKDEAERKVKVEQIRKRA